IFPLSLHDALPIFDRDEIRRAPGQIEHVKSAPIHHVDELIEADIDVLRSGERCAVAALHEERKERHVLDLADEAGVDPPRLKDLLRCGILLRAEEALAA